jgi:hypothetical protein
MSWMMKAMSAAVLTLAFAGCASGPSASGPCASCKFGVSDQKASPPMHYCMVEGKKVNCAKSPAECPDCAKAK